MADITTSTLKIGDNNLILRDADAQAKLATHTQKIAALEEDTTSLKGDLLSAQTQLEQTTSDALAAYATDTAYGAIASFSDGADGVPVKSLVVNIEPVQSGSGDPSPTNIRPISGHDTAKVTRTGKNLLDYADKTISTRITSVTDNGDGSFTVVASGANATIEHIIPVTAGETYTIKCESATNVSGNASQMGVCTVYDGETSSSTALLSNATYDSSAKQFTPTGNYVRVVCKVTGGNGAGTGIIVKPQLELGTTVTPYEPFADIQTVTIDLDGTIYGGTLDVTTGVLTVDRERVDLGTLNWTKASGFSAKDCFYAPLSSLPSMPKFNVSSIPNAISSMFVPTYQSASSWAINSFVFTGQAGIIPSGSLGIIVTLNAYTDASAFKTGMSGQQIMYELAEPFEVTLTGQDITTVLGQNNIWSDAGDVEVEYRADTKLYIEKLTAPTEDDMIADHAISANTFFMIGNTLYRATTAIASGATITVGTNATILSLSDALNALA